MKLVERELGLEIELKENVVSVLVVEGVDFRLSIIYAGIWKAYLIKYHIR